jgi:hypothetical protein
MAANTTGATLQRVGVLPLGAGLTVTLVVGYLICWAAEAASASPRFSHAWLGIFSTAPAGSAQQLIDGVLWSLIASWVAALLFAPVYNLTSRVGSRS